VFMIVRGLRIAGTVPPCGTHDGPAYAKATARQAWDMMSHPGAVIRVSIRNVPPNPIFGAAGLVCDGEDPDRLIVDDAGDVIGKYY